MTIYSPEHFLVLDFETTGVDPLNDRIVTAFLGFMDKEGNLLGAGSLVVNPMVPIPAGAAAVHGYTTERVEREANSTPYEAVTWLLETIRALAADGVPVIGHNLQYDLTMLEAERTRWTPLVQPLTFYHPTSALKGVCVIDTLVLDKAIDRRRKGSRKLIDTARHYGVHLSEEEAHGAQADAVASGRIALRILQAPALSGLTFGDLHTRQIGWKAEQAASLQAYFRRSGKPDAVVDGRWPVIPPLPQTPTHTNAPERLAA